MRHKIGVLFPSIDHSQRIWEATQSAHKILDSRSDVDLVFFYESINNPFIVQRFGTAHISHLLSYDGVIISSDAKSARRSLEVITSPRKVLYNFDIEWKGLNPMPYEFLMSVYRHPSLEVVARSDSHAWALSNSFNLNNVRIVKDFNLEELVFAGRV